MTHNDKDPGLRSQLLREVRQERQQCFAVAEAAARQRFQTALNCPASELSDTVAVFGIDSSSNGSPKQRNVNCKPAPSGPASVPGHGAKGWGAEDDIAQADALRALRYLGDQTRRASELETAVAKSGSDREGNQDALANLQRQIASLSESLAKERDQRESMQQQMLCLEQELDAKEATISDLERVLERKDEELVRRNQSRAAVDDGPHDRQDRVRTLEHQLRDRERQLEAKDGHITRLLSVLRQHRGIFLDEESTACASDRSVAMSNASG